MFLYATVYNDCLKLKFMVLLTQQSKNACHHLKSDKHQDPTYSPQSPSEKSIDRMLGIKNLLQVKKQTNKKTLRWRMKIPKFGQLLIGLIKLLTDDLKMSSLFLKPVRV